MTMYCIWKADMLKANDSKNWLFAKASGILLKPSWHPQTEGEEERFGCVVVNISEIKDVSTHHQRISMMKSLFIHKWLSPGNIVYW